MNYWTLGLGIILLLAVIIDLCWTTLWVDRGAGPITNKITDIIWGLFRQLDRKGNGVLGLVGPVILLITLVIWVAILWFGWTLIFASFEGGVENTARADAITMVDYLYYAGYVIFSLGNGEITPTNGTVQLLTSLGSASGMLNLSLAVSYVLSIVDGVVKRRTFASSISGMGSSAEEIVIAAWDGKEFHDSDIIFHSLAESLGEIAFAQKAYPLLNYYHSVDKKKSIAYTLPILDDAVSLLDIGVANKETINPLLMRSIRSAIDDYMESISKKAEKDYQDTAQLSEPDLSLLAKKGIKVIPQDDFNQSIAPMVDRRRKIANMLKVNWPNEEKLGN
ncbi:hypothetical protein HZY91_04570 [Facklamia sp. DSM 111018]|uniref:Potassium channel domain-containing protein n=1 Tax=Facklamia lactis TaxID=2749967 RepID=A0ABS0LPT1_9LACT|nr:hypothetical protein [Facklamia lactis]MBG9986166.1 hypothetical protein [Facklamia lactis]